jgi:5'-3' exonuclease
MRKKTIMIDWHNIMYRNLYIAYKNMLIDDNYGGWKHLMTKTILDYVLKFKPDRVVIAIDSKSWRKKVYPEYKAQRLDARKASLIDYEQFYKVNDGFVEELKKVFPNFYWMRVKDSECDDIVAILTKERDLGDITIVSSDKDFIQLLKFEGVKIFSPCAADYLESLNPLTDLDVKIIMGDSGDNIPAILPKTGPVKATKYFNEGILYDDKQPDEVKENIKRNRLLISFEEIPEDVKKSVLNTFDSIRLESFGYMKFLEFCVTNSLKKIKDDFALYTESIKHLTTEVLNA